MSHSPRLLFDVPDHRSVKAVNSTMSSDIETKVPPTGDQTSQDVSHNANYDEKAGSVVDIGESYTIEEERAVLRKIDFTILPMMCAVFFLQYLDKQSLSYASVRYLPLPLPFVERTTSFSIDAQMLNP